MNAAKKSIKNAVLKDKIHLTFNNDQILELFMIFMNRHLGKVEILREKELEIIYFLKPSYSKYLPSAVKEDFV
jgi:hypothetical protein